MVKDFYEQMGFTQTSADEAGNTTWELTVADYAEKHPQMEIER